MLLKMYTNITSDQILYMQTRDIKFFVVRDTVADIITCVRNTGGLPIQLQQKFSNSEFPPAFFHGDLPNKPGRIVALVFLDENEARDDIAEQLQISSTLFTVESNVKLSAEKQ